MNLSVLCLCAMLHNHVQPDVAEASCLPAASAERHLLVGQHSRGSSHGNGDQNVQ